MSVQEDYIKKKAANLSQKQKNHEETVNFQPLFVGK